jgi:hypothetical protein
VIDWTIVGAGLHGVHLAIRLFALGVDPKAVLLLDPSGVPFSTWRRCTRSTGMRYLRSPSVHHIGLDPFELIQFAKSHWRPSCPGEKPFYAPYDRPALSLFDAHLDSLLARFPVEGSLRSDRALRVRPQAKGFSITTLEGEMLSRRVVLALGTADQPEIPSWVVDLVGKGVVVRHLFEREMAEDLPEGPVGVVGAGISAVQVAIRLAAEGRRVVLATRHALREHLFDSDPGWMGPRFMNGFLAEPDFGRRRAQIRAARHLGSAPPELLGRVRELETSGQIRILQDPTVEADAVDHGVARLGGERVCSVVLCTGSRRTLPGGLLVRELVEREGLRCAACGFPIPDARLQWIPGLYLMGALAELELGPVARNIKGAQTAAARILAGVQARPTRSRALASASGLI